MGKRTDGHAPHMRVDLIGVLENVVESARNMEPEHILFGIARPHLFHNLLDFQCDGFGGSHGPEILQSAKVQKIGIGPLLGSASNILDILGENIHGSLIPHMLIVLQNQGNACPKYQRAYCLRLMLNHDTYSFQHSFAGS